jgi:uncharacterized protein (DUF1501 family)
VSHGDFSRRDFLKRLGLGSAIAVGAGYGLSVWQWGDAPAHAATLRAGRIDGDVKGRTLVIVELGGGNDGLNTLVPHADGAYHDLRPTLGITDSVDLDGKVGLHPKLTKLAKRYKDGHVAIIEGIGYDDPDLSHFGSFAIWWSAKGGAGGASGAGGAGWLGAYLDATVGFDDPLAAIGIGPGPSPAMLGRNSFATTIADATGLRPRLPPWVDNGTDAGSLLDAWSHFKPARVDTSRLVGQVQRDVGLTQAARTDLDRVLRTAPTIPRAASAASARASDRNAYRTSSLADSLTLAATLIQSPAKPRLIYVNGIGDFDTHQGEVQRHPVLMQELDDGVEGLFSALPKGAAEKVALMTVSEFGRRPAENGSGTDHGTANVHFVVGPKVRGGRYGESPSLTKLDANGNLVHTVDFRRLYATGLRWLNVTDTEPVMGGHFQSFPVLP